MNDMNVLLFHTFPILFPWDPVSGGLVRPPQVGQWALLGAQLGHKSWTAPVFERHQRLETPHAQQEAGAPAGKQGGVTSPVGKLNESDHIWPRLGIWILTNKNGIRFGKSMVITINVIQWDVSLGFSKSDAFCHRFVHYDWGVYWQDAWFLGCLP